MTDPAAPFTLGRFQCVDRLGVGAMGEVWRARDADLGRWIALKILKNTDEEELARFKREAQVAARLSHPNIAATYMVGEADGRHYIAMQLIEGRTLRAMKKPDPRDAARWVRDAALAVDYAHQTGIVHRDLKPENIMVERGTVERSNGGAVERVFVMDFGLARSVHDKSTLTATGVILGTPAYMPPEQARGDAAAIDARSDVYGLGATLYDLLAGRPPFQGPTVYDLVMKVINDEPPPPRGVERELETILLKCLEKDPRQRYPSARALADDLTRWLDGEPIAAHAPSLFYRLRKRVAKRRGIYAAVALAVLAVLAVLAPLLWRASAGRARAEDELRLWERISGVMADAEVYASKGHVKRALARLDEGIAACEAQLRRREFATAHYFVGRLQRLRHRPAEAQRALDRALELDPALGEASLERGLLAVDQYNQTLEQMRWGGRGAAAIEELERAYPELRRLKERAIADLAVPFGHSSYFKQVDRRYGRAVLTLLRGDEPRAKRELEAVVADEPLHWQALVTLAWIAQRAGDHDEAIRHASEAVRNHGGIAAARLTRMISLLAKADNQPRAPDAARWRREALDDMNALVEAWPPQARIFLYRGIAHMFAGGLDAALGDLDRALQLHPENALALATRGDVRFKKGDPDGALRDFDAALRLDPSLPKALVERSALHAARGDAAAAMRDADEVIRRCAGFAHAHYTRGRRWQERGEPERAAADYGRCLELDPRHVGAWIDRGNMRQRLGDLDGAIADRTEAIRLDPYAADAYSNRAASRLRRGDAGGARRDAEEAMRLDPALTHARLVRAEVRLQTGDLDGALDDVASALRGGPTPEAHLTHARVLARRGDRRGALDAYDRAVDLAPRLADLRLDRGGARIDMNDLEGALDDFEEAVRLAPNNARARYQRGVAKGLRGDHAGARADYDEAIRLDPRHVEAYCNRASIRLRVDKDVDGALADCEAALALNPRYAEAYANRGLAHLARGNRDATKADLRKALQVAPPDWPYREAVRKALAELDGE